MSATVPAIPGPLSRHLPALGLLLLITLFRWFLMGSHELHVDEAYYWDWSRNLAPAYYDQGPGVAFAIAAGTALFGHTEQGVRFAALVCGVVVASVAYVVAVRMFRSALAGVFTLLFFHLTPLNALGGILMMHDSVMYLAWSLLVAGFLMYLETKRPEWLYGCALAMAAGLLSKHTMVLISPAMVLLLLWCPPERTLLKNIHAWGAVLAAVLLVLPLLYWNIQHDFAGVYAIVHLPTAESRGRPWHDTFLGFLFSEAFILGPVTFLLILGACVLALRPAPGDATRVFLAFSTLFMFAFFLFFSLRKNVSGNWPVCGFFGGTILLGGYAAEWWQRGRKWIPVAGLATSGLLVLLGLFPKLMIAASGALGHEATIHELPVLRLSGGREIGAAVDAVRARHPGCQVAANQYQPAALMAFYLKGQPRVYSFNVDGRPNQYDFWESPNRLIGQDFVYLQFSHHELPARVAALFESVELSPPATVERLGQKVVSYRIAFLHGFKGLSVQNPFQRLREE